MNRRQLGIDLDDLRLPIRPALATAAKLKFIAVEMAMVQGELAPRQLSMSGRRQLAQHVRGLGLDFCAVVGDLSDSGTEGPRDQGTKGGRALSTQHSALSTQPRVRPTDPATNQEFVDRTRELLRLAVDMRVPIVTARVAALTDPATGEATPAGLEALRQIGRDADSTGAIYALRPTQDSAEHLVRLLADLNCASIRICLDPAALVMSGLDPLALVQRAPEQIVLAHARDATAGTPDRPGVETPLGEGDVDLDGLLMMLEAADCPAWHGPLIIRRRDSQRPQADILQARAYLEDALAGE